MSKILAPMDTRDKIIDRKTAVEKLGSGRWTIVAGLFDPLTVEQAERFAAFRDGGRKVLAIVLDHTGTLLSIEARAALVASLRAVTAVLVDRQQDWKEDIPSGAEVQIEEDLSAELRRSEAFVEFVLSRQQRANISAASVSE